MTQLLIEKKKNENGKKNPIVNDDTNVSLKRDIIIKYETKTQTKVTFSLRTYAKIKSVTVTIYSRVYGCE